MSDDINDIRAFYDNNPEREHQRLDQHQLEYDLTWRYFEQYLPPTGSILEVGAATGRYTVELARRGYAVTAVDLSPALIDANRQNLTEARLEQQVRLVVADARDLSAVTETNFDAVLLMGPLYHLIVEVDRKTALQQAYDRLRPGGLIFTAFISRFGTMADLMRNNPGWIDDQAHVQSVLHQGKRPDAMPRGGFRGYLAHVPEIIPLHESIGFETITLAGVEPLIAAYDESYNQLEGDQRERWLDLLDAISTEPSILGASRHLIYVGRKT